MKSSAVSMWVTEPLALQNADARFLPPPRRTDMYDTRPCVLSQCNKIKTPMVTFKCGHRKLCSNAVASGGKRHEQTFIG